MRKTGVILKKRLEVKDQEGVRWAHGTISMAGMKMHIHYYLVDRLAIDTGPSRMEALSRNFFRSEKIIACAATHYHEDHTGIGPWLTEELKVPFYIAENDIEKVKISTKLPLYRAIVWGNRKGFSASPLGKILETENHRFQVIHAPGHSHHHVAFYEPAEGWLFTGDIYVSSRQRVAFVDEHMGDMINTLDMLSDLDFQYVFCSHAGVLNDGKERLRAKSEILKEIQGRVRDLHQKGLSVDEINKTIYPKKDLWFILTRGEWSSRHIISTLLDN